MLSPKMYTTIYLLSLAYCAQAQPGCTDPQAMNFNANATQNDGSCLYPITSYAPVFKSNLGSDLKEISGLDLAKGEWWGHNDSGFDPDFFSIDPENGGLLKKISLKDAHNRDWEDVCSDGFSLYFGDFGNNNNDRQNLGIYRVPFSAIGNGSNQTINANEYNFLPFAYPDQTDYSTTSEDSTIFDCEAMIFTKGKLHLFLKNRKEYQTTHYAFNPINSSIQKLESFDTQGLITGASLSPDGKTIALVGYDIRGLPIVFCWLLWDWQAGTDMFFSGNKRRIELGSAFSIGQVESIGFNTNRSGYIANERTEYAGILFVQQRTWAFDFSPWLPQSVATQNPSNKVENLLRVYPNPSTGILFLESEAAQQNEVRLQVINPLGIPVLSFQGIPDHLDLSHLQPGIYTLHAALPDATQSFQKFLRI